MTIAVFGSINIDLTTYSKALPRPGETLHGDRYAIGLGGKGCNQAAAVSKLGGDMALIGRIGRDDFGQTALTALADLDVATDAVALDEEVNTGIAVIGVDAKAENCITVIGGANMAITSADVEAQKAIFENANILLLQLEIPLNAAMEAADLVRSSGGRVILDPAPAPKDGLSNQILASIDIITPNETETELLTGLRPSNAQEAAKAAELLLERGIKAAIIKLGANGVYYRDAAGDGFVEPYKVSSIDSVAAGDCFNGGLAFALDAGKPLGEAVQFAAACGALSTTKRGAASSAPSLQDVEKLMAG